MVTGLDGWSEWARIVHRSMLRKRRHGIWRNVAGWLAGCIHCIVEPDQASGGGPDRKYRETSGAFLGLGLGRMGMDGGGVRKHGLRCGVVRVGGRNNGTPATHGRTRHSFLMGWKKRERAGLFLSPRLPAPRSRRCGTHARKQRTHALCMYDGGWARQLCCTRPFLTAAKTR